MFVQEALQAFLQVAQIALPAVPVQTTPTVSPVMLEPALAESIEVLMQTALAVPPVMLVPTKVIAPRVPLVLPVQVHPKLVAEEEDELAHLAPRVNHEQDIV